MLPVSHSPPFHEARTQPELAVLIREGKIPDLPKPYTPHLGQVVKAMLKQNVSIKDVHCIARGKLTLLTPQPRQRPNTSQIKALDNVKLQIRVIELRKAYASPSSATFSVSSHIPGLPRTKELRFRNQDLAAREADLLAREGAVLLREQSVLARENNVRANIEAFKDAHAKAAQQAREASHELEPENARPRGSAGEDVLARVASRPSLVPRRPLEERRAR